MRDLARLHRYASGLSNLMASAQSRSPQQAEGSDNTGAVWVVLGPDGLPETIRVESQWRRVLGSADIGDAVVEASRVAANQRMASWTRTLGDEDWTAKADRLREDVDEQPESHELVAADLPPAIRQARPRAMEPLAEDVLAEFDKVDQFTGPQAMTVVGTGSDNTGRVTIVMSKADLTSCAADQRWASQQSGAALNTAFGEALAAARKDLEDAADQAPNPMAHLDQLLGEALALLADPQRLADS